MKCKFAALMIGAAALLGPASVLAQAFPSKPITIVVPFSPGAASDSLARVLAQEISASLGQPVVIDNKPGAGGATGPMLVANANPDGHYIGIAATGAIAVNPHIANSAPLNPKDLAPVAKLADIPLLLVANANAGYPNLQSLLSAAKASAGGINVGNNGQNTAQHLAAELLASMTGAKTVAVPYKGSAPAATAVLGGEVPVAMVDLTSVYPHIKAGKLIGLGVTTAERTKVAPELPTIAEGGVPGYAASGWLGLFAPAKTPAPAIAALARAVEAALAKPDVQAKILAQSSEPAYLGPVQFSAFVDAEQAKWGRVIGSMKK